MILLELMMEEEGASPLMSFNYNYWAQSTSILLVYYLILLKTLPQTSTFQQSVNCMIAVLYLFSPILVCLGLAEWPIHSQGSITLFTERKKEGREGGERQGGRGTNHLSASSHLPCHHLGGMTTPSAEMTALALHEVPLLPVSPALPVRFHTPASLISVRCDSECITPLC